MRVCLRVHAWFCMCISVHVCVSVSCLCACMCMYSFMHTGLCVCADKPAHVCLWSLRLMGGVVLDHPPPYLLSRSVPRITGLLQNALSLPLESWDYRWATMPLAFMCSGSKLRYSHSHRKCFIRGAISLTYRSDC